MGGIAPIYYYLTLGSLAGCVVVGFYIAFRFQREVNEDLGPTTEKDLFDPLQKAFYSGLMDEAEFKRIQESMDKQKQDKRPEKRAAPRPKPAPESSGLATLPPVEGESLPPVEPEPLRPGDPAP